MIKLQHTLFLSLCIHLLMMAVDIGEDSGHKTPTDRRDKQIIELINVEQLKKAKEKSQFQQIVRSDQRGVERKDPQSKFLGKKTQTFQKQTVARKVAPFQPGGRGEEATPPQAKSRKKKINLSDLGSVAMMKGGPSSSTARRPRGSPNGHKDLKGQASSNDFIQHIPLGDFSQLNTVEYKYFGFYERLRKKLERYWGVSLHQKVKKLRQTGGRSSLYRNGNYRTSLVVNLNREGKITKVYLQGSSGVKELDNAAIESFNKAGPFPNPPRGLLSKEGVAKIRWDFIVQS